MLKYLLPLSQPEKCKHFSTLLYLFQQSNSKIGEWYGKPVWKQASFLQFCLVPLVENAILHILCSNVKVLGGKLTQLMPTACFIYLKSSRFSRCRIPCTASTAEGRTHTGGCLYAHYTNTLHTDTNTKKKCAAPKTESYITGL